MNKSGVKIHGAVIVTRVSGDEQAKEGTSLETQLAACRVKALSLSLPIIAEYEDAAISGAFLLARPGMQAAIADIQANRADTLLCPNISRYSRDVEHQQQIKKAVKNAGGRLVFCDMDFDDTPEGDLAFSIMGGFAEYERKVIRERTMKGRRHRAAQGIQTARGWSPYGYTIPKTADLIAGRCTVEEVGKYFINEAEAEIVRWLFQSYAAGSHSLPGLVRELNQRGVPTKKGAAQWHPSTIHGFFNNTVYIGRPTYGKLSCTKDEGQMSKIRPSTGELYRTPEVRRLSAPEDVLTLNAPSLVDQVTWDKVQARLATNKAKYGGDPSRTHMLSGRVVCEICGSPMTMYGGKPHKGYPAYYSCSKHRHSRTYTGTSACSGKEAFKVPVAEGATVKAIEDAARHPEGIKAALAEYRKSWTPVPIDDVRRELAALSRALNSLAADEAAAVQAQIAGIRAGASPDAYSTVFADLAARRKDFEDRRVVVSRAANAGRPTEAGTRPSDDDLTTKALADVSLVLRSMLVPEWEKRQAVGMVVEKVYCRRDGAVVTFHPGLFDEDTLHDLRRI